MPKKDKSTARQAKPRGKILVVVVVAVLAMLAIAGIIYYLVFVLKPAPKADPNNQFVQAVDRLLKAPVPDDPIQKAIFYAQVAQNYDNYGDVRNALTYFLKAQKVIDDNKLQDQIVYYQAIADKYQAIGDMQNYKTYLQLQLQYLQKWATDHPDDTSTKNAIEAVNKRLNEL